ncbi:Quinate repressor protein [Talaromyces atroroseus]|uniref:Quinate repressor protein n=1 Tax=Talaromyces atroroseus TaxID=1441469 RepID=A0A225ARE4_TALAT|nr:Quinate repressor protein [Talaromyces atroroseus]OKL57516.1 Quinate repressor protein [Talaromyces atroroseus]
MDTASLGRPAQRQMDLSHHNPRKRRFDQTEPQQNNPSHASLQVDLDRHSRHLVSLSSTTRSPTLEDPENRFESPLLPRQYSGDESIILVGFPGTGKKTLGLIASAALRKEFIDFDTAFTGRTGLAPREYIEAHGAAAYRNVEDEVTIEVIHSKQKGFVLVGFFAMASNRQRCLLKTLSSTNPIIHVQRDLSDIIHHTSPDKDRLYRTYQLSEKLHRRFANFEFFNITQSSKNEKALGPLKLKATEGEFIRFLHRILPLSEGANGLASLFTNPYTYALQVPMSWLEDPNSDYTELDSGADAVAILVEITQDYHHDIFSRLSQRVAVLRKYCHVPIIIDLETSKTLGYSAQINLFELVLRQAPDIIVVSLDTDSAIAKQLSLAKCHSSIIGKYHQKHAISENWHSKNLPAAFEKAKLLDCSAVRLTGEAQASDDNLEFVLPSQAASEGVTLAEAQQALYSSFWRSKKHFTVFGQNVSYSLTPAMHRAACNACGMPHTCDYVESDHLSRIREFFERETQGGLAIVYPYKTEIVQMMDELSVDAKIIGAVNTVVIERITKADGPPRLYLKGFNTDHIGLRTCIEKNLSPANAVRLQTSALIIGAGGMARAAIYACVQADVKNICIFNRTEANAHRLVDYFAPVYPQLRLTVLPTLTTPWPTDLWQPTIIVSCIPAHKVGGRDAPDLLIPEQWLGSPTGGVFVEFAYKPLVTRLIKYMQSRRLQGWIIADGLDVLVEQGIAQFEILTKRPAPSHVMRRTVREQYSIAQHAHASHDSMGLKSN